MIPPLPYLDLAGYKRRSKIAPADVELIASTYPGYIEYRIARGSSYINSRLAKRYATPLGQTAPALVALGAGLPQAALSGRVVVGSYAIVLSIIEGGLVGTSTFAWSSDGGQTFTSGGTTSTSPVPLGATGLAATFAVGTYPAGAQYSAATPVPEIALGWLVSMLDMDVWDRRGVNAQDPRVIRADADLDASRDELKEAADAKEGLFELPTNDQAGDSAVNHEGPLFYSEASPYVSADRQEREGVREDIRGTGTHGGA
jgi:hypothetical protein